MLCLIRGAVCPVVSGLPVVSQAQQPVVALDCDIQSVCPISSGSYVGGCFSGLESGVNLIRKCCDLVLS